MCLLGLKKCRVLEWADGQKQNLIFRYKVTCCPAIFQEGDHQGEDVIESGNSEGAKVHTAK